MDVDKPSRTIVFATDAKDNPQFPRTDDLKSSLAIPQIFGFGLRNPWRFSFDRLSGKLWAADVGQNQLEEINIVEFEGNYGWKHREGDRCFEPQIGCKTNDLIEPIFQYEHSHGRSVTGGFVYRGTKIPGLYGHYIFGDFTSGKIWAFKYAGGEVTSHREIFSANNLQIASFAQDNEGELYVVAHNGNISRLEPSSEQTNIIPMPRKLSQTGCFANMDPEKPINSAVPIEVNAALWSDGASKTRFAILRGREKASVQPNGQWKYPLGMTLIKNFFFDVVGPDGKTSKKIVETRFLIKKTSGFKGYSYKWNDEQTEAQLLSDRSSKNLTIKLDSQARTLNYLFPSSADCASCHSSQTEGPLALTTMQTFGGKAPGNEQWRSFVKQGLLSSLPRGNFESLPGYGSGIADHAKSYLHVHCGSCHNTSGGPGRGEFSFDFPKQTPNQELCNLKSTFRGQSQPLIDPNRTKSSVLFQRLQSKTQGERMPQLATSLNSSSHLNAIEKWIGSIDCKQ